MKNMRKMILLTATGLLAAGNSARAQALTAPAGQAYTIINTASATAVNPVTYQWYRDNNAIAGATSASYTVPRTFAYGENVQFYRLAKTVDCTGDVEKKSNTVTVTFTGYIAPEGCKLIVNGVCWANAHVDAPNTFAARADVYKYYQWNKLTAYSADEPLTPEWNATPDNSATWTVNPCPPNWRIPTREEYQDLYSISSTWANANTRGNQVAGRFYGYSYTTCTLPNSMNGCVFFPAAGLRNAAGTLTDKSTIGYTWTSVQFNNNTGYRFAFQTSGAGEANYDAPKADGLPIRCVQ